MRANKLLLIPVSDVLEALIATLPADQERLALRKDTGKPDEDYELSKAAAKVRITAGIRAEVRIGDLRSAGGSVNRCGTRRDQLAPRLDGKNPKLASPG